MAKSNDERLAAVSSALDFLEQSGSNEDFRGKLESAETHHDVIAMASEQGFEITRESLAEALKIHVDRALEREGLPSWVRARIYPPVHD